MNNTDNIKERFKQLLQILGIGQKAFETKCGMGNGTINNIKNGISSPNLEKIMDAYPEVNIEWLISGNGEAIKSDDIPHINYTKGVPYYDVDFICGFDLIENDQTTKPNYLIDFKKYNEATCWCNVTGHSMEPEITHGDIIALKRIEDISFLPLGEVYAIVTTNGMRTIKRLGPADDEDCYTLIPTNKGPEYGIQKISKDKIAIVFQVLGCMKRL